jgi:hypothetical protein
MARRSPRRPAAELGEDEPPREGDAPAATVEPLEPGGEIGESREVAAGGSGLRRRGRAPRTRVVLREQAGGGTGEEGEE